MQIIIGNDKKKVDILIGRVAKFNHDNPHTSFKIFWVEAARGQSGWCKGEVLPGSEIRVGNSVSLKGQWKTDPRYPSYGKQFFFSSYEVKPDADFLRSSTVSADSSTLKDEYDLQIAKNGRLPMAKVKGCVQRFTHHEGTSRIFMLKDTDGNEFYCVGSSIPGKEIYEDYMLSLVGNWGMSPKYGRQFYYKAYDITPKDRPTKVVLRKKVKDLVPGADIETKNDNPIIDFLRTIEKKTITYEYHYPKNAPIALHVKRQLDDRIVESSPESKDFYFLTALLDRNVADEYCQWFRNRHREFKQELLACWKEDRQNNLLLKSIRNLRLAHSAGMANKIKSSNKHFAYLLHDLPSRYKETLANKDEVIIDQLFSCLKIIYEKYEKTLNKYLIDTLISLAEEKIFRAYLRRSDLFGIGPKLSNWAITNITGHWFVIDEPNIKPVIKNFLSHTIPVGIDVSAENADIIFEHWFGKLDEVRKCYTKLSQKQFNEVFPSFNVECCEYLPFILTQCLWFYGKSIRGNSIRAIR